LQKTQKNAKIQRVKIVDKSSILAFFRRFIDDFGNVQHADSTRFNAKNSTQPKTLNRVEFWHPI